MRLYYSGNTIFNYTKGTAKMAEAKKNIFGGNTDYHADGTRNIFNTDKRIKLGIWGLGRGGSFVACAKDLNIDVVAGCDFSPYIREKFAKAHPEVAITDNEDEFLKMDIDAVLVATWFPYHADHCIKALNAGKHVMCEVTSFMKPSDGVRLVEAVEKSGKVYNLLENYPFAKQNMYARKLWQDGLFGDFVYAEYDYNHDCRTLQYTYVDCAPLENGWELHNWRSWLNGHYYNTHSLGPVMQITGLRPVEVSAMPCTVSQPGALLPGGPSVSMIRMSNGGIMRNLMGNMSHDTHTRKIWGTKAAFDFSEWYSFIYLGANGRCSGYEVKPEWPELGDIAEKTGHGGGDFWELYYFARQILTGEKAPWDIYSSCDVCLAGIMSVRSQQQGGIPVEVPDFRDPAVREKYRHDDFIQDHFDPATYLFPEGHDKAITGKFSETISHLIQAWQNVGTTVVRRAYDGMKIYPILAENIGRMAVINDVKELINTIDSLAEIYRTAREIIDAYPDSHGARVLRSLLELGEEEKILNPEKTKAELTDWLIHFQ